MKITGVCPNGEKHELDILDEEMEGKNVILSLRCKKCNLMFTKLVRWETFDSIVEKACKELIDGEKTSQGMEESR